MSKVQKEFADPPCWEEVIGEEGAESEEAEPGHTVEHMAGAGSAHPAPAYSETSDTSPVKRAARMSCANGGKGARGIRTIPGNWIVVVAGWALLVVGGATGPGLRGGMSPPPHLAR